MNKLVPVLIIFVLISCKKDKQVEYLPADPNQKLYGNWVGNFEASKIDTTDSNQEDYAYSTKINLLLKKIINDKVIGFSIVEGHKEPLLGVVKYEANKAHFIIKEPFNHKHAGKYDFVVSNDSIIGTWLPYDSKAKVIERELVLTKQKFKYNPKAMLPSELSYIDYSKSKIDTTKEVVDGVEETYYDEMFRSASEAILHLNASTMVLKEKDLKNLKKLDLEIIRNTIFARHGYTFKKKSFRQFFDSVDWYIPLKENVYRELTPIEQRNIVLINRLQKYAEDHYDSFGR
jgi:hypothetical protein